MTQAPQRRPAIRAVSFDEVGEAITRLIVVAGSDTGQSARVADFLLAWWNGDDSGHFPILHLCNCDATISEDMLMVISGAGADRLSRCLGLSRRDGGVC